MSILANAIASIELGVEDYNLSASSPNRALSAARNLYAGVLLLLKHRLALVSESLVYQKLKPVVSGAAVSWVADGKKTIDFVEIRDRWKQLGWNFNFALLEKVQKERNNIEHWYAQTGSGSLAGAAIGLISPDRERTSRSPWCYARYCSFPDCLGHDGAGDEDS